MGVDYLVFNWLNSLAFRCPFIDALGIFLAKYFPYILVVIALIFLLKNFKKYFPIALRALVAAGLGLAIAKAIRFFWLRPRPFIALQIKPLLTHSPSSSFPSFHATFFFAFTAIILIYCWGKAETECNKKLWLRLDLLFFGASLLIVIARIFCGLHWPSDILGGIGLGIVCALLIHKVFNKYFSFIS